MDDSGDTTKEPFGGNDNLRRLPGRPGSLEAERRRAEAALRESEERYRELANSLPQTVFEMDLAGHITFVNRTAFGQFGYTDEEFARGLNVLQMVAPADRKRVLDNMRRVVAGEDPGAEEYLALRKDGTVFPCVVAANLVVSHGVAAGLRGFVVDTSEIHDLQDQRDDILYRVSHDLRSPLQVIKVQAGILQQLLEEDSANSRSLKSVDSISIAVQRLDTMIEDLLDSAGLESGQMSLNRTRLDLHAFVCELMERLAGVIQTERIKVIGKSPLPLVLADADRLERIVVNLLVNALKFSEPGTDITVEFQSRARDVVTAVRDRGPGIAPAEQPHLFQRFRRVEGSHDGREGLGLGLYTARRMVEAHRGKIWVESEVGMGSSFYFSLPSTDPE